MHATSEVVADGQQAIERIKEKYSEAVRGTGSFRDQYWVEIDSERLVEICSWLREDPANSYDLLLDVTAIHWPDDPGAPGGLCIPR